MNDTFSTAPSELPYTGSTPPITDTQIKDWLLARRATLKGVPDAQIHAYTSSYQAEARFIVSTDGPCSICQSGDTVEEAYQAALSKIKTPAQQAAELRRQADEILAKAAALDGTADPSLPVT